MDIKRVGVFANKEKAKARDYSHTLCEWLRERGVEVFFEEAILENIAKGMAAQTRLEAAHVDLLIVFGGDGTLLRTARLTLGCTIPIVGINLGGFGYLTEVNLNEMYSALEIILTGNFETDERMMLDASFTGREGVQAVLNDAVINRANLSRILELETYVNGKYLITYKADGLIAATPTGSTAYALSAGGPIVFPNQDSILIIPICPHTLTNRPLILPADACVQVILRTREQGAILTLDGQLSFTLYNNDIIDVKKSNHITTLVSSPHRDYLEILRTKLGWVSLAKTRTENS
ncbi:MAG: NAD(+)/NADH kinase [Syntrophales bacterium LBB04]|nr:NAD(+)/NADH kinase [Syntrophales bacterium LBB04]